MTAQTGENISYKGATYSMCSEPLSDFAAMGGKLPEFIWPSTDLWRGYIGDWEVVDDRLYLVGLEGELKDGTKATIESVFPGYPDRVFAHWYSGTIRIPLGEMLSYVHMGYESVYERDLLLTFEKGVLISSATRRNDHPDTEASF